MEAPARMIAARPWRTEIGATLSLAWPLILANLTMALIQATDVLLMGRLGARPLAASALGLNLNFAFSLICLGLVTASSPMIATALGRPTGDLDPTVAEQGLAFMSQGLTDDNRGEAFGPEQSAPDDADAYERVAAFAGRSVRG